jgi:hypothetical protein
MLAAVAVLLVGAATSASAQYKIVGPDGKVTYTDKPPAARTPGPAGNANGRRRAGALPYEVQQAMSRFPVTLYAAKACAPLRSGAPVAEGPQRAVHRVLDRAPTATSTR